MDCHKAAYVPVCIAGDETTTITAEPAVVVPNEMDEDLESIYEGHPGEEAEEEFSHANADVATHKTVGPVSAAGVLASPSPRRRRGRGSGFHRYWS